MGEGEEQGGRAAAGAEQGWEEAGQGWEFGGKDGVGAGPGAERGSNKSGKLILRTPRSRHWQEIG